MEKTTQNNGDRAAGRSAEQRALNMQPSQQDFKDYDYNQHQQSTEQSVKQNDGANEMLQGFSVDTGSKKGAGSEQ